MLGPGGGCPEGGVEQLPAARLVALREHRQREPAPDARPQRLPPDRLVGVERGQHLRAAVDDHRRIALPPGQLGPHERHPAVDVDLTAPGQGGATDPVKLAAAAGEVAAPGPHDGEPGLDVGEVAPRVQLAADGHGLLERGDRRGIVGPEVDHVGQDGEHERDPPPLADRPELAQRDPELFLDAVKRAPSRWRAARGRTSPWPAATGHAPWRTGRRRPAPAPGPR